MTAATVDISYVSDEIDYDGANQLGNDTDFERFIKSLPVTEPLYASRLERVWMWSEAQEQDTGDLVAVQCKFFSPRAALPKGKINWFLGEPGKHPFRSRLLVTTAGRPDSAAEGSIRDQQIPVNVIRLEDLVGSTPLGSRTAQEWVLDRYKVKTDKPSGIVNGPVVTGHR